jgi:hypothetical protein
MATKSTDVTSWATTNAEAKPSTFSRPAGITAIVAAKATALVGCVDGRSAEGSRADAMTVTQRAASGLGAESLTR